MILLLYYHFQFLLISARLLASWISIFSLSKHGYLLLKQFNLSLTVFELLLNLEFLAGHVLKSI